MHRLVKLVRFHGDGARIERGMLSAAEAVVKGVKEGGLRSGPTDASFDTSLCMAAILRFPEPGILETTMRQLEEALGFSSEHGEYYFRYRKADDFGTPKSAFLACSFWMAQAYARIGNKARGRQIFTKVLGAANEFGLFSEHFDPKQRLMLGNFPQAYSHVGLINSAFAISPDWEDVL